MGNQADALNAGWPVARYRFRFTVQTPISLPEYAGSMLRGVFGQALRRIACMTREPHCPACPLHATCPYTLIFETPPPASHSLRRVNAVPNPYAIEPPPWGARAYRPEEDLVFDMVLFGHALEKLPLVIFAWQRAFARTVGYGTAALSDVLLVAPRGEESVWDAVARRVRGHQYRLFLPDLAGGNFRLTFDTPLRLQDQGAGGKALPPDSLTAGRLLMDLVRRISLLAEFHADCIPAWNFQEMKRAAASVSLSHCLRWRNWKRWSNRQNKETTPNGLVGQVNLHHVPECFHEPLQLGQWTHLGKSATFGLGRYALEEIRP